MAKGKQLFDDQQYEESIQVLSGALVRPTNTKEDKLDILRTLAFDYIILDRKEEAEAATRSIFVENPEFTLPASDSPKFRDFFQKSKEHWIADGRPGLRPAMDPNNLPLVRAVPTIAHTSPTQVEPKKNLVLVARITDSDKQLHEVKLLYRLGDKGKFAELLTQWTPDGLARTTVPGTELKGPILEYYFVGLNAEKLAIATRGDSGSPFRVAISDGGNKWVVPVVIGASVLAVGAVFGALALAGVFDSSPKTSTVTIRVE